MEKTLEAILSNNRLLWRGRGGSPRSERTWPTGFPALTEILPDDGWAADALLELVVPQWGVGELQLLLPAMVAASQAGYCVVLIAPPFVPYASALAAAGIALDRLLLVRPSESEQVAWAMEQTLREDACAMVLAWPGYLKPVLVRRLQLAAEAGQCMGVLFQSQDWGSSPAALRLRLFAREDGLQLQVLKSRASCQRQRVDISFV